MASDRQQGQQGTAAPLSSMAIRESGDLAASKGHDKGRVSSLCRKVSCPDLMVTSPVLCLSLCVSAA